MMTFKTLPNDVRPGYNIKITDQWFSLWYDSANTYYIRNRKVPNVEARCLDLSEVEAGVPYIGDKSINSLRNHIKEGKVLFQNNATRQRWFEALL